MVRLVKRCLQLCLKLVNSMIGLFGITMIMYSLWLIRVWQRDMDGSSSEDYNSFPWFVHALIVLGISFCAITCLGHVAADTAYSHFLSCYIPIVFLLLLLETATMVDIFLNSNWEKDLPVDPSGRFDDFKDFVESNMDVCKWIGGLIILAQGISIFLATVIKTLRTDLRTYHDSDDDSAPPRLPLLYPALGHPLPQDYGDDAYFTFNKCP